MFLSLYLSIPPLCLFTLWTLHNARSPLFYFIALGVLILTETELYRHQLHSGSPLPGSQGRNVYPEGSTLP